MKIATNNLQTTPFLIIGSGIVGLYTALKLSELDVVTFVDQGNPGRVIPPIARGIAAAVSPADSRNCISRYNKAGAGLCLRTRLRYYQRGTGTGKELMQLGSL